jgi:hypothetical protein
MYFLRRIGASAIDIALFLVAMLLTGWICMRFNTVDGQFEVDLSIFAGLLAAIFLPILLFSSTVGERIFSLHPVQVNGRSLKLGLLFKYLVAYGFLSFTILNTINFFRDMLSTYTIFSFLFLSRILFSFC